MLKKIIKKNESPKGLPERYYCNVQDGEVCSNHANGMK
jgi:hypothetical protein